MFFEQIVNRIALSARIAKSDDIAIMSCRRCESREWDCKLSFLFSKCSACVLAATKCEAAEIASLDFAIINRAMKRLKKKELKTKTIFDAAVEQICISRTKLRRLRKQKKFFKNREKKLFDKNLSNVEEFERLKELEKVKKIQRVVEIAFFVNDFFTFEVFFSESLFWLDQFVVDEILEKVSDSFWDFRLTLMCFLK